MKSTFDLSTSLSISKLRNWRLSQLKRAGQKCLLHSTKFGRSKAGIDIGASACYIEVGAQSPFYTNRSLTRAVKLKEINMPYKDPELQRACQNRWARARRNRFIKEAGGCCIECSSTKHLEFHHRKRTKHGAMWTWSTKRLVVELRKCDLLCAECHKVETARERKYGTAPHGTITSYKNYGCRCKVCRTANAKNEHRRRLQVMNV